MSDEFRNRVGKKIYINIKKKTRLEQINFSAITVYTIYLYSSSILSAANYSYYFPRHTVPILIKLHTYRSIRIDQ